VEIIRNIIAFYGQNVRFMNVKHGGT